MAPTKITLIWLKVMVWPCLFPRSQVWGHFLDIEDLNFFCEFCFLLKIIFIWKDMNEHFQGGFTCIWIKGKNEENSLKFSKGGNHYIVVMKRKFKEQWLTVLPILTKRNNHFWPQIIEHKKTDICMTFEILHLAWDRHKKWWGYTSRVG